MARQRLFEPLGIHDLWWETGPDGVSLAAHGLHLRPRDFAKLGQLALDGGKWRGQTIVPADWMAMSTAPQVESTDRDHAGRPLHYGFYWWIAPEIGFAAAGHGGQYLLIQPSKHLLLVQIALPDADLHGSALPDFLDLVAPLLR